MFQPRRPQPMSERFRTQPAQVHVAFVPLGGVPAHAEAGTRHAEGVGVGTLLAEVVQAGLQAQRERG